MGGLWFVDVMLVTIRGYSSVLVSAGPDRKEP